MNSLRIREFGSSEWTYIQFVGELGDQLKHEFAGKAEEWGYHVQELVNSEWENYE